MTEGDEPAFVGVGELKSNKATEDDIKSQSSSDKIITVDGLRASLVITPSSYYNYIDNPAFQLWTKGDSFNTPVNHASDCYRNIFFGGTQAVSKQECITGTGVGSDYFSRIVTVGGSGAMDRNYYEMNLENIHRFANKRMVFIIRAKADGNKKLGFSCYSIYGTGETPRDLVYSGIINVTNTMTTYNIVLDMPSLVGKTLGSFHNLTVYIFTSNCISSEHGNTLGQQSGTFDIEFIGLYDGEVAPPIVAPDISETTNRCERFIQRYGQITSTIHIGTINLIIIPLRVKMRATPTLTGVGWVGHVTANYTPHDNTVVEFNTSQAKFAITHCLLEA